MNLTKKQSKVMMVLSVLIAIIAVVNLVFSIFAKNKIETLRNETSVLNETIEENNEVISDLENSNSNLKKENKKIKKENKKYKSENKSLKNSIETLKGESKELVYLGKFKITFYCAERYNHICGGSGTTASGAKLQPNVTIAVDTSKIPFGSQVIIDGFGKRIAQDRGGAVKGNHIDICVPTHAEAMSLGTLYKDVWILV